MEQGQEAMRVRTQARGVNKQHTMMTTVRETNHPCLDVLVVGACKRIATVVECGADLGDRGQLDESKGVLVREKKGLEAMGSSAVTMGKMGWERETESERWREGGGHAG